MSKIGPRMSPHQLLAEVRALVLRELEGLEPSRLVLRLDDVGDQSVCVVARLGECGAVMVARVYEVDLCSEGAALHPVYLSGDDADALVEALDLTRAPRASSSTPERIRNAPTERRPSRAPDSAAPATTRTTRSRIRSGRFEPGVGSRASRSSRCSRMTGSPVTSSTAQA